jgi:cell division protein FtsZ
MVAEGIGPVNFAALNTDVQALRRSRAPIRLQLGEHRTKGRGTGADVSLGRAAAWDHSRDIENILVGADLIFITTGLGGGTGTGAAPVVAKLAKDLQILTIGVVTTPFGFEGNTRCKQAQLALPIFRESVDALITISNDFLLTNLNLRTSLRNGFALVDDVLKQALTSIVDLLMAPGLINIDFADLQTVLRGAGTAFFGIGRGSGEARSLASIEEAMHSSFFEEVSVRGAKSMLVNISGGRDLTLHEVNEAATIIRETADIDANIIFGATIDDTLAHQMKVTIVAAGFEQISNV